MKYANWKLKRYQSMNHLKMLIKVKVCFSAFFTGPTWQGEESSTYRTATDRAISWTEEIYQQGTSRENRVQSETRSPEGGDKNQSNATKERTSWRRLSSTGTTNRSNNKTQSCKFRNSDVVKLSFSLILKHWF